VSKFLHIAVGLRDSDLYTVFIFIIIGLIIIIIT